MDGLRALNNALQNAVLTSCLRSLLCKVTSIFQPFALFAFESRSVDPC